jgi:hypothetical protein
MDLGIIFLLAVSFAVCSKQDIAVLGHCSDGSIVEPATDANNVAHL